MRRAVPGKARVHELAKELGITSKDVLSKLKELGEFVKSASSTVEAPVARRLRDAYPKAGGGKSDGPRRPQPQAARPQPRPAASTSEPEVPEPVAQTVPKPAMKPGPRPPAPQPAAAKVETNEAPRQQPAAGP